MDVTDSTEAPNDARIKSYPPDVDNGAREKRTGSGSRSTSGSVSASGEIADDDKKNKKSRGKQTKQKRTSVGGPSSSEGFNAENDLNTTEDVLSMLENVTLTEEEADDLLQDALALNRRLRRQLDKQSIPAPLQRSQTLGATRLQGSGGGIKGGGPLPPISYSNRKRSEATASPGVTIDIYTAKMNRRSASVPHAVSEKHQRKHGASAAGGSEMRYNRIRDDPSPSIGKLSAQRGRPEWNERFPYS